MRPSQRIKHVQIVQLQQSTNSASTSSPLLGTKMLLLQGEGGRFSNLKVHTTPHWQFFSASPPPKHTNSFLCLILPPFHPLILRPRVSGWHHTGVPNLKGVSSLCALTGLIGTSNRFVADIYSPQTGEIYSPQTDAFIEILSLHLRSPSLPTKPSSKRLSPSVDGPKKQMVIHNSALSKDETNTNTGVRSLTRR